MKKQFTILLIIILIFFCTIFFDVAKANDNGINIYSYKIYNVSDQIYKNNVLCESFKKVIEFFVITPIKFINKNLFGIIFLILAIIFGRKVIHNYFIKKKYKIENGNDKKFKTMCCKEDEDEKKRKKIYLINKKSDPKTYQWIVDGYTFKELGYEFNRSLKKDDKCFSMKDKKYVIKNRIKIHNIFFDVNEIFKIKNIKEILKN